MFKKNLHDREISVLEEKLVADVVIKQDLILFLKIQEHPTRTFK